MAVMSGEVSVTLPRDGNREPFGFRLRGGSDLKEAFIIQRIGVGTPAEGELRRGDLLIKINGRPTSRMTHQEASDMIKNSGTTISLVVHRAGPQGNTPVFVPSGLPPTSASLDPNHQVSTLSGQPVARKISEIMLSPVENLPVTVFPESQKPPTDEMDRERERIVVTHQPYRTTPLVLPGAKVGRDTAPVTQSYLALQQTNPMLWNAPSPAPVPLHQQQSGPEVLLKQKLEAAAALVQRNLAVSAANEPAGHVAVSHEAGEVPPPKQELVHKQFNSPLGLYSSENVQEVVAQQSGIIQPAAPSRPLDLKQSETLRALKEESESANANRDGRGLKEVRPAAPVKTVASNPHFKVNVMGLEKEKIQQSHSFKRLMADVLGETDF